MGISEHQFAGQHYAGQQYSTFEGTGLSGAGLFHDASGELDSVSSYFECITACSIDDGECVTRCVEVLREQP